MLPITRFTLFAAWFAVATLPWFLATSSVPNAGVLARALAATTFGQIVTGAAPWLVLVVLPLIAASVATFVLSEREWLGRVLAGCAALGIVLMALQGFAIGHRGWSVSLLANVFGGAPKQGGMGLGAFVLAAAYVMLLCQGLAMQGYCRGDVFTATAIGSIIGLIAVFVFAPILVVLSAALRDDNGALAPLAFLAKTFDGSIWGLGCIVGGVRCGVAWNTLFLALCVGVSTTLLGLAFALIATRTGFRAKGALRVLTVLPIITPPFVIGLALILLFGRSGMVTGWLADTLGIPRSRWIYGFWGVFIAQTLAFTPIAFLVLIGVVQGVSATLEEAASTLRASAWKIFATVTFPLLRPGIANAFLLGFVESMADFGNPLVLGGNFEVLSTKIFFAVVGAANDPSKASVLAIILLVFTLGAFFAQQQWLGKKSYTTVTGKGDSGVAPPLPRRIRWAAYATALPWAVMTAVIYLIIVAGSFVKSLGRDNTPTVQHYATAFSIEWTERGLLWTGSAWNSFWTTLQVATIAAPLTAAIGILTAWLLTRQTFAGQRLFEFGTMLSFAIPGTVVGVSYILAYNVPPIELTGTGLILIICFVFRNMPVGVRSGIAGLAQLDKSLDEASTTLGARSFTTFRRIILPLLRPAIVASLVYAFVRAMTAVSAVIFLVSAEYNLATTYIVGRVEAGEFGLAIAYSTALIVVMVVAVGFIQLVVGERHVGRRSAGAASGKPSANVALAGVG